MGAGGAARADDVQGRYGTIRDSGSKDGPHSEMEGGV